MSSLSYANQSGRNTSIANIGKNTKNWYRRNLFENTNTAPKSDIYSVFSKKTEKSVHELKSRT